MLHQALITMRNPNSIHKLVKPSDIISAGNGLSGIVSIFMSIQQHPVAAAALILVSGVLDFFDGRVARKYGYASEFGKQLDSLCDLVSFIVAPVVFAFTCLAPLPAWQAGILVVYVAAGLLRLARFNVTGTVAGGRYFEGMPVPFSIAIIGLYFVFRALQLPMLLWLLLYLIHAGLMVSTLKIRKL